MNIVYQYFTYNAKLHALAFNFCRETCLQFFRSYSIPSVIYIFLLSSAETARFRLAVISGSSGDLFQSSQQKLSDVCSSGGGGLSLPPTRGSPFRSNSLQPPEATKSAERKRSCPNASQQQQHPTIPEDEDAASVSRNRHDTLQIRIPN